MKLLCFLFSRKSRKLLIRCINNERVLIHDPISIDSLLHGMDYFVNDRGGGDFNSVFVSCNFYTHNRHSFILITSLFSMTL